MHIHAVGVKTQTRSWDEDEDEDTSAKGPISRNSRDAFSVLFISIETIMETRRNGNSSKLRYFVWALKGIKQNTCERFSPLFFPT